jgi:hypothetical protein
VTSWTVSRVQLNAAEPLGGPMAVLAVSEQQVGGELVADTMRIVRSD